MYWHCPQAVQGPWLETTGVAATGWHIIVQGTTDEDALLGSARGQTDLQGLSFPGTVTRRTSLSCIFFSRATRLPKPSKDELLRRNLMVFIPVNMIFSISIYGWCWRNVSRILAAFPNISLEGTVSDTQLVHGRDKPGIKSSLITLFVMPFNCL